MAEYGIIIGKFSPVHYGHLKLVEEALKECSKLIIFVGSSDSATNIENPFTYQQREDMLKGALSHYSDLIQILPLPDFLYNNNAWMKYIQKNVSAIAGDASKKIVGCFDGSQASYLKWFNWPVLSITKFQKISSSHVRKLILTEGEYLEYLPKFVSEYLEKLDLRDMYKEWMYVENYKKQWESAPYPPIFVTVDGVIVQSGHVLVIKRGGNPGKGKYALPGGFLNQDEYIQDACLREVCEETHIDVPGIIMEKAIVDSHVFDYPYRSVRGRTITHAFLFKLNSAKSLPVIRADDDAAEAKWMSFADVETNKANFFEDHYYIISYFLNRGM